MKMFRHLRVLAWLLSLAACATPSSPPASSRPAAAPRSLLLVSLDGVHPDDLARGDTPHLERLAREGVRAQWMVPSYPVLTFPNHYTIVTGLRPDRHGIVHNTMHDPALGRFTLQLRDAVGDGRWWGGEPLWVTAERAGMPTAVLAWPGSEAPVQGVRPTRWHLFDASRPIDERVRTVAGWLAEPEATRPRLAMYGYDTASPKKFADSVINSAFVAVVAEEDKGLGAFTFDANGNACEQENNSDPDCFTFDEGKNLKYFTFSMSIMDTVGGYEQDTLLANLTFPGHQLNQPEVDWMAGDFYPAKNTLEFWDFSGSANGADYNFNIYNTEIARRGSWLGQDIYKVHKDTSNAVGGLLALPSWKQGIMNQGGPADVMSRRIVIPNKGKWSLSDKKAGGNPYAFRNMECTSWSEIDNPYYPGGLCLDSAINLSGVIPDTCQDSDTGEAVACPQVDLSAGTAFGISDTNPVLQGANVDPNKTKVLSWHQCPSSFTTVSSTDGTVLYNCTNDLRTDASTLADQSWYNPLDVAKGHRGFLDGDMVMMLYAWSPNWRLNAKGSDRYELYIRRSFTGATTWTTLPSKYTYWDPNDKTKYGGDGTVTCETFRSDETQASGDLVEPRVCNSYAAGADEQARNVTQHQSMRITTLDPRYAITGSPQGVANTLDLFGYGTNPYGEDVRNPSRYFVVYETGDNTTTSEGEPEPLDLFYSRAVNFGDDYQVWAEETDLSVCYPSDPHDDIDPDTGVPAELIGSGFCNEFDQMEQGTPGLEASESSLTANPGGQFLYGTWTQVQIDEDTGEAVESDAMTRRVWWLDGYISADWAWDFGQGSGDGVPAQ